MSLDYSNNNNGKKIVSTGERHIPEDHVIVKYPIDRYDVYVRLSLDKKFLGIEEIILQSDFRKFKLQTSKSPFRIIEEYEPE